METERIKQALEESIIRLIQSGDAIKMDYDNRVDVSAEVRKAYAQVNYTKVFARITELIEETIAQKIANKIITEMGTNIKDLMSETAIRDDFKILLKSGVADILQRIRTDHK